MANDLDTFVLQYKTDLTDSLQRLERLQQKMQGIDKAQSKAGKGLKDFATGAAGELDKMIPGLSSVANAVKGMGAEFAVAAGAVGALAIGIKSVMDLQSQFNAQRLAGMQLGVSGTRVENYQRAISGASGGMVSRDAALSGVQRLSQMSNDAFTDPSGMKRFQMQQFLGVNPGSYDNPTGINDEMRQMATSLQGKSGSQVQGIAKATGFSQDWLLSLQKLGPAIGEINNITQAEITQRQQAEQSLAKFNDDLSKFKETINELDIKLGENLLPAAEKFVKLITTMVDAFNKATAPSAPPTGLGYKIVNGRRVNNAPPAETPASGPGGHFGPGHTWISDAPTAEQKQAAAKAAEEKKKEQAKTSANVTKLDEANSKGIQTANQTTLAMNLFSSAVATFSGAVDQHQAWAAWAGNIGAANGVKGSSNAPVPGGNAGSKGLRNNNPGNLEAGAFATAHGATGTDGRFAIFPSMEAGVAAHGALLDSNYYAKGLDTPRKIISKYAPASENNQGAYLAYLKSKGFDSDKPITDKAGFNTAQMAFESGYGSGHGIGQSRESLMLTQTQQAIAGALGVPVQQLTHGGVGKGDVQYATDNLEAGYLNSANQANARLQNPVGLSPIQVGDFKNQLLVAQRGLAAMETYKKQIIDGSNGPTSLTTQRVGGTMAAAPTINFNINAAGMDAKTLAKEIDDRLQHHMQTAVNSVTNQEKG
ncbi:hypothetical protein [Caballeronia sordidicola]|uniref:hypothetical protein n=1 Tax=Caballeronia sordidicola TaxID=196367 RepID=UPI00068B76AC|nr:hypothetical protein [Caballeronia sordidicola]